MDLSGYQTRILQLLSDPSGVRYTTLMLSEALRQALNEFNNAAPRVITTTFTPTLTGKTLTLDTLDNFIKLVDVCYPYNSSLDMDKQSPLPCSMATDSGDPVLTFDKTLPPSGSIIRIVYTAGHTIKDLDSELTTTIMPAHETTLVTGAAAYCVDQRVTFLIEKYGGRSSDVPRLEGLASTYHKSFRSALQKLESMKDQLFPQTGFPLDSWDIGSRF